MQILIYGTSTGDGDFFKKKHLTNWQLETTSVESVGYILFFARYFNRPTEMGLITNNIMCLVKLDNPRLKDLNSESTFFLLYLILSIDSLKIKKSFP
jgi:hypothetical protein